MDTTRVLSVGGSLPPTGAAGEMPEFDIKPPLGAPLLSFTRGYLLNSSPQDSGNFKVEFSLSLVSCQRPSSLTSPFASYAAATRSQQVIFAYDQVNRPNRSYRPSGGLHRSVFRGRKRMVPLSVLASIDQRWRLRS